MSEEEPFKGMENAEGVVPEPVTREQEDVGETGTMLERVVRDDRGETHYHWFLEGQISQPDAENIARRVFNMSPEAEFIQEDMFDSITIILQHTENKKLSERAEEFAGQFSN